MKHAYLVLAAILVGPSAFAADDSAKIPATTIPLSPSDSTQVQAAAAAGAGSAPSIQVQPPSAAASASAAVPAAQVTVPPTAHNDAATPACPTETGSHIRSAECVPLVRSYSHEQLESTGEVSTGAALGRLDPSITYRRP